MTQQSEREPLEILSEADVSAEQPDEKEDQPIPKVKRADNLDLRRFTLGSSMLGWCLFLMLVCIGLSFISPENELVKSGFEAFKLIVMTILGYIFGSNQSKDG